MRSTANVSSQSALPRRGALGLCAAVAGVFLGCQGGDVSDTMGAKQARIEKALASLLRRKNDDAFVILEDRQSGKFVQFAGGAEQRILLDLPSQPLNEAEAGRAEAYFRELGIEADESDLLDGPGGEVSGRQRTFQKSFGRDAKGAAKTAVEIFERVYQFPADFEMVVDEN